MITYFIRHSGFPGSPIKIGRAKTINHRIKAFRDYPRGIELLGYLKGDREMELQSLFHAARIDGGGGIEWFEPCKEIFAYLLDFAIITVDAQRDLKRDFVGATTMLDGLFTSERFLCNRHWMKQKGKRINFKNFRRCVFERKPVQHENDCRSEQDVFSNTCKRCCLSFGLNVLQDHEILYKSIGICDEKSEIWLPVRGFKSRRNQAALQNIFRCADYFSMSGWHLRGFLCSAYWPHRSIVSPCEPGGSEGGGLLSSGRDSGKN